MTSVIILVLVVFGLAVVAASLKKKDSESTSYTASKGEFRPQIVLTKNEQPMFWRLQEALGAEFVVLSQVSFQALISPATSDRSKSASLRGRIAQKRADFVICKKDFGVLAVIELDDSSHKGRAKQDADRDALLASAGIRTVRYQQIPSVEQVRIDLLPQKTPVEKELEVV